MTDTTKLAEYTQAYGRHIQAIQDLIDATELAFPIGTRVMSQQRHGVIVEGEVIGICRYHDYGCVIVKNIRTDKSHRAYPFSEHSHFEVIHD